MLGLTLIAVLGVVLAGCDGSRVTAPERISAAIASPLPSPTSQGFGVLDKHNNQVFISMTPWVALPAGGGTMQATSAGLSKAFITIGPMTAMTTGSIDTTGSAVTTTVRVKGIDIKALVNVDSLVAVSQSNGNGTVAASNSNGSAFFGLTVLGVPFGPQMPAPNTRINFPGGQGSVILNEQIKTGDGVQTTGLTVNMVHLFIQSDNTEVIIGSSMSGVQSTLPGVIVFP